MGGPGALLGAALIPPALIGIVLRRGIDPAWLAEPPLQVAQDGRSKWRVTVPDAEAAAVTVFSPTEVTGIASRLRAQYGNGN